MKKNKKTEKLEKKGFGGCSLEQYLKEKREQIKKKTRQFYLLRFNSHKLPGLNRKS